LSRATLTRIRAVTLAERPDLKGAVQRPSGSVWPWTTMTFPESVWSIVPGALAPVRIDRRRNLGPLRRAERLDAHAVTTSPGT